MNYQLLFPSVLRIPGRILSLLSLIGLLFFYFGIEIPLLGQFGDEVASIGFIIGLLISGFSRQKVEDEMIGNLRLEALQWSMFINYGLLIICIILFYDMQFLQVLMYNMFTTLLVFNIRFTWLLYSNNPNEDKSL